MEAAERLEAKTHNRPLVFRTNGQILDLVGLASYVSEEQNQTASRPALKAITSSLVSTIHSEIRDICAYIEERHASRISDDDPAET